MASESSPGGKYYAAKCAIERRYRDQLLTAQRLRAERDVRLAAQRQATKEGKS